MDKLRAARKAEEAQRAKRLAASGASEPAEKAEPEPLLTFVDRMFCARSPSPQLPRPSPARRLATALFPSL